MAGGEGSEGGTPGGDRPEAKERTFLDRMAHWVTRASEAAGIAILVIGAVIATGYFLSSLARKVPFTEAYHRYRGDLGRAILLGLEFLVAADIISTVAVEPTLRSVVVLGLIVLIRTFLSFSLEVEIEGRWPWQVGEKGKQQQRGGPGAE